MQKLCRKARAVAWVLGGLLRLSESDPRGRPGAPGSLGGSGQRGAGRRGSWQKQKCTHLQAPRGPSPSPRCRAGGNGARDPPESSSVTRRGATWNQPSSATLEGASHTVSWTSWEAGDRGRPCSGGWSPSPDAGPRGSGEPGSITCCHTSRSGRSHCAHPAGETIGTCAGGTSLDPAHVLVPVADCSLYLSL